MKLLWLFLRYFSQNRKDGRNSGKIDVEIEYRRTVPTEEDIRHMKKIVSVFRKYGKCWEEYAEHMEKMNSKNKWSKLDIREMKHEVETTMETLIHLSDVMETLEMLEDKHAVFVKKMREITCFLDEPFFKKNKTLVIYTGVGLDKTDFLYITDLKYARQN